MSALAVPILLLAALLAPAPGRTPAAGAAAADANGAADGGRPQAAAAAARGFGRAVRAELNRIRRRHGLPRVAADARMARTAKAHSRDMLRRGYFAHGAWGGRVARAAGSPRHAGEVIGRLPRSSPRREARGIVRAWMHSPSHRSVLLDGSFRRVGIGRAAGRFGGARAALYTVDWASRR